ncbi:MAG: DUF488 domain-containing protein [Deltaproteobacteria bacterium]|nr:DUF488 domain-containing protein [Deltaproteobacteria bacterium]
MRVDAPNPTLSVLTIGHSNHPIEKFLGLVRQHGVEVLVDAHSQPVSRFSPQFSRRVEAQELYQRGIERLLDGIARFCVCILCAEEDPSHCHRRLLISRTLVRRGVDVQHVPGSGEAEDERELGARQQRGQLSLLADAAGAREGSGR